MKYETNADLSETGIEDVIIKAGIFNLTLVVSQNLEDEANRLAQETVVKGPSACAFFKEPLFKVKVDEKLPADEWYMEGD